MLASEPPGEAMLLAGGTDLLPNMKRRQQTPRTVIGLRKIAGLRRVGNGTGVQLGAGLTLTDIVRDGRLKEQYAGLWQATAQVATPHLRNMATLGGNLCLDTRCNYYDQNYEWRKAIDFCMKKDGTVCWVATSSPKCLAVSSTDIAPALMTLGARVRLQSKRGDRDLPLHALYRNDGIHYLTRRSDEMLTEVLLEPNDGGAWKSTYWKLRRRGSFDFPVLSVAAAVRFGKGGVVEEARIALGAVASRPLQCDAASELLAGKELTDAVIADAAELVWKGAKPMDNTDLVYHWRKRVTREYAAYALRELRGDDMRETRIRTATKDLLQIV
jgi:4-hydroxybenzoyl-CoA reductase subunit beta